MAGVPDTFNSESVLASSAMHIADKPDIPASMAHTVASVATDLAQSQLMPEAEPSLAKAQPEPLSDGSDISANSGSS